MVVVLVGMASGTDMCCFCTVSVVDLLVCTVSGLIFSFCIVSVADVFVCTVSGADMLECDIALTKDLRLILLHESWLGEITDAKNKLDPTKKKTRSDYNLLLMNPFFT